jgi:hypothetical protein
LGSRGSGRYPAAREARSFSRAASPAAHLAAEDRDTFMQLLLGMVEAENEQANRRQKDE